MNITACGYGKALVQSLGLITYEVSNEWKMISDVHSALYFNYESDLRVDVRRSSNIIDNIDLLRQETVGDTSAFSISEPIIKHASTIDILGTHANKLNMTGLINGKQTEFVLFVFTKDRTGYAFCFSQTGTLSDVNMKAAEKIIRSIDNHVDPAPENIPADALEDQSQEEAGNE